MNPLLTEPRLPLAARMPALLELAPKHSVVFTPRREEGAWAEAHPNFGTARTVGGELMFHGIELQHLLELMPGVVVKVVPA